MGHRAQFRYNPPDRRQCKLRNPCSRAGQSRQEASALFSEAAYWQLTAVLALFVLCCQSCPNLNIRKTGIARPSPVSVLTSERIEWFPQYTAVVPRSIPDKWAEKGPLSKLFRSPGDLLRNTLNSGKREADG